MGSDDAADSAAGGDPVGRQLHAAERQARANIQAAQQSGDSTALALRHAELGMILTAQELFADAVTEFRTSLGYVELLRADGEQEQQRLLRMTSPAAPPPTATDVDLNRLEAELRVATAEALAAAGQWAEAQAEVERARPQAKGFFRRRLRQRLDRVATTVAAGSSTHAPRPELQRHLANARNPEEARALRLRLANALLDEGRPAEAGREALLLLREADEVGDQPVRAGARQVLGLALEAQGRPEDALPVLTEAFHDLHAQGDTAGLLGMAEALALRLTRAGDYAGAATTLRTAQQSAALRGDAAAELSVRTMLGSVLDAAGDRAEAITVLTEAAERARELGLPGPRSDAQHGLAVVYEHEATNDDVVEALSLLDEAKAGYREAGHPERVAGCDHEAAALLGRHRSFDAARSRYEQALAAYRDLPEPFTEGIDVEAETADCERNLRWLAEPGPGEPPPGAFASGGHTMSHDDG